MTTGSQYSDMTTSRPVRILLHSRVTAFINLNLRDFNITPCERIRLAPFVLGSRFLLHIAIMILGLLLLFALPLSVPEVSSAQIEHKNVS
jgi:hypothetical protein